MKWRKALYNNVSGIGLKEAGRDSYYNLISGRTVLLSGKDHFHSAQTRTNAVSQEARLAWGRIRDHACSIGSGAVKSSNHTVKSSHLQQCYKTRDMRVTTLSCNYFKEAKGFMSYESICPVNNEVIFSYQRKHHILDDQMLNDRFPFNRADSNKVKKYSGKNLLDFSRINYGNLTVRVASATMNWRGIWSPKSAKALLSLCLITKNDIKSLLSGCW